LKTYSNVTHIEYEPEDCVFILNLKQVGLYIKHGAELCDVIWSRDSLVFVFEREKTRELYDKWCKRELN